jgi:hypothetical protein
MKIMIGKGDLHFMFPKFKFGKNVSEESTHRPGWGSNKQQAE